MVFSEPLFLLAFFPLCMLFYALARSIHAKNVVLLVFSLVFYAFGGPAYLLLLIGMALADWVCARLIERNSGKKAAKFWMVTACVVDLGLLGIFKYTTFLLGGLHSLVGFPAVVPQIVLPIGISFYTFQLLSYVIDVYRGEVPAQKRFFRLLLYVSLFHQCIAGPIVRYKDVSNEIVARQVSLPEISAGVTRFTVGLAKKALLANACGALADQYLLEDGLNAVGVSVADNAAALAERPAALLWLGVLAYMLQIYLDFSAYSDMAIGMGLMVGFHYRENFEYPYLSASVTEFWRRWHISLSSFFRDYVYIPLGGSRCSRARNLFNLLVVWALTGLWHGASWNFVLWGLYFFVFLALEKLFFKKALEKLPRLVSHLYLLIVVFFGWILFRFRHLSLAWITVKGLFCANGNPFTTFEAGTAWLNVLFLLLVAMLACTPLVHNLRKNLQRRAPVSPAAHRVLAVTETLAPVLLMGASLAALVGASYNPFLYFQF